MSHERTSVSVITGFLGSGKTTLLGRLLRHPEMVSTAVVINEFGEIGLDHDLIERIEGEVGEIVVMKSGCLCCTIRNDLITTLEDLHRKRAEGSIPHFAQVVIESTGLADPAPILHTLMDDLMLDIQFSLESVVTTVDAILGNKQLDAHFESVKQAAVADRLVLTKTDVAREAECAALEARLRTINSAAPIIRAVHGNVSPSRLFDAGPYDPKTKSMDVEGWLRSEAYSPEHQSHGAQFHGHDMNRHDSRIRAHCFLLDKPIQWRAFNEWLGIMVKRHGEQLLRVKGILNVEGETAPVAVHGVQHVFTRSRMPTWKQADQRSRLVFITRDLDAQLFAGIPWEQAAEIR